MKMKKLVTIAIAALMFTACGENTASTDVNGNSVVSYEATEATKVTDSEYELLDAFADLKVTYEGLEGAVIVKVKYIGTDAYIKSYVDFETNIADDEYDFYNGDEITVTAVADFDSLHRAGYDLLEKTKTYTIEGLSHTMKKEEVPNVDFNVFEDYTREDVFDKLYPELGIKVKQNSYSVGDTCTFEEMDYIITNANIDLEEAYYVACYKSDGDDECLNNFLAFYHVYITGASEETSETFEVDCYVTFEFYPITIDENNNIVDVVSHFKSWKWNISDYPTTSDIIDWILENTNLSWTGGLNEQFEIEMIKVI